MPISHSEEETQSIAATLAPRLASGGILLLYGDLGSGKTSFTKGLAQALGIEKFSIKSPTYTYIRQYSHKTGHLYHIDLYRLEGHDQLLAEEIQELAQNKQNIIIIEWADKLTFSLADTVKVHCEYHDKNSRKITIE